MFKVFVTPEVLFGYLKLKKALTNDPEIKMGNKIVKRGNGYYIRDESIENYFEGISLKCLVLLLGRRNEFIYITDLDGLFESEFNSSLPTVKKRRDKCLKDIKQVLAVRLDVPVEATLIRASDESDKRVKMIKINPELF